MLLSRTTDMEGAVRKICSVSILLKMNGPPSMPEPRLGNHLLVMSFMDLRYRAGVFFPRSFFGSSERILIVFLQNLGHTLGEDKAEETDS